MGPRHTQNVAEPVFLLAPGKERRLPSDALPGASLRPMGYDWWREGAGAAPSARAVSSRVRRDDALSLQGCGRPENKVRTDVNPP